MKDFANAMTEYSEHAFKSLCAESQPHIPNMERLLIEFAGAPSVLALGTIEDKLKKGKVKRRDIRRTIDYLIESNFLGVMMDDSVFHFPVTPIEFSIIAPKIRTRNKTRQKPSALKIHNAFHSALLIE